MSGLSHMLCDLQQLSVKKLDNYTYNLSFEHLHEVI